jgi:hypothetical protein
VSSILAVLVVAAEVAAQASYYEAKVLTFGCTSIPEVHRLLGLRSDPKAFQGAFLEKQIHGECVAVMQGTGVQGTIESSDPSILRMNEQLDPPGYEAPLEDFELKGALKDPS